MDTSCSNNIEALGWEIKSGSRLWFETGVCKILRSKPPEIRLCRGQQVQWHDPQHCVATGGFFYHILLPIGVWGCGELHGVLCRAEKVKIVIVTYLEFHDCDSEAENFSSSLQLKNSKIAICDPLLGDNHNTGSESQYLFSIFQAARSLAEHFMPLPPKRPWQEVRCVRKRSPFPAVVPSCRLHHCLLLSYTP